MRFTVICLAVVLLSANAIPASLDVTADKRLAASITAEFDDAKLADVMAALTKKSGVQIKAGSDSRDWRVHERRITLRAKDAELATVVEGISKLLTYHVSRYGKDGEWTYLIWQDVKSRQAEERMRLADLERAMDRSRKVLEGAIDTASKALEMSPEDARAVGDKDPWLGFLGGTKAGRGVARILSDLGPYAGRQDGASFDLSDMSPDLQAALRAAATSGFPIGVYGGSNSALVPSRVSFWVQDPWKSLDPGAENLYGGISIIGRDSLGNEGEITAYPVGSSQIGFARQSGIFGLAFDQGVDAGAAVAKADSDPDGRSVLDEAMACESETEKNPPTDPSLTREVEIRELPTLVIKHGDITAAHEDQSKVLAEISRAAGLHVMFESFDRLRPLLVFIHKGKQPLYKILIGLEKAGYAWTMSGQTLLIRPEDWATRRSYVISEGFLQHYRDLLAKQRKFTADDVASIADALTDEQFSRTLVYDRSIVFAIDRSGWDPKFLRFYASLTASQKSALRARTGLSFGQLTRAQWDRLSLALPDDVRGGYIVNGRISLVGDDTSSVRVDTRASVQPTVGLKFDVTVWVDGQQEPWIVPKRINLVPPELVAARLAERQKQERKGSVQQTKPGPAPTVDR